MKSLFKPITINKLEVPNRIAMAPMTRMMSPDGIPGENVKDYYQRRAIGEVGLIITEGVEVSHPSSSGYPNVPGFQDKADEGWEKIVKAVQEEGSKNFPQLWHVGAMRKEGMAPDPKVPGYTPSGLVNTNKEAAHAMSAEEVEMLIECFVKDIIKIKDLGFDGVELHGAHGYLIDNFFWEGTNQRDDTYGGEIDKRTKFACEIIKRARKEIGRDFPIAIRFSQWKQQDYEAKIAHTPEELEKFLMPLVDAGVDVFHASNRRYWESEFEGSDLNLAGWTKKISGLPTITVGSVGLKSDFIGLYAGEDAVESAPIDELVNRLDAEEFDMVAVGRALLSDPEWVKKIKEERFDEIIPFESKFAQSVYY